MPKSASYFIHRARELGPGGSIRRIWQRSVTGIKTWSQSQYWGWKARRGMDDAEFLSKTIDDWGSIDKLLEHLSKRPAESFLLPHGSQPGTTLLLRQSYTDYISAVIDAADSACRGELNLLDQTFQFPDGVNWLCDPVTGWQFPLFHRSQVGRFLGSERPVDLIFFWELNRHQHFISLGIAYWLTGDNKYVDTFCSHLQSWVDANPVQHGVNWYYGLEVAIRLIAWTAAFQFFRGSSIFQEKIGKVFLKSVWQQTNFLYNHLQTMRDRNDVPNNHMVAELTGLILVGMAFPEFRQATSWVQTGIRLLNEQIIAQTHPDGVNKEQATGYHRFIAELLILIMARRRQNNLPAEPVLEHALEAMLDYVLFCLAPTGVGPMWGDSDYGRALGLGKNKSFWDFRPLLSAGAALFGRADWKYIAEKFDEEAFLLLGNEGLAHWNKLVAQPPEQTSHAFPNAGLYIIRDSWTDDTDLAIFRCGSFGLGGEKHCAHAHCDLLSFMLWVGGQPVLVDSGTYMYHGPLRNHFRLTESHNTLKVNGQDQAVPMPNFNWEKILDASCLDWDGEHIRGKLEYPDGVQVFRELAHPQPGIWNIEDRFDGKVNYVTWFFHFAPGLDLELVEKEHVLKVSKKRQHLHIVRLPEIGLNFELKDSWYSDQYGVKQVNQQLVATWQGASNSDEMIFRWQFQTGKAENLGSN